MLLFWYLSRKEKERKEQGNTMCNGTAVHGFDVTVPDQMDFLTGLAVFYSFLPWFVTLCVMIWNVINRSILAICNIAIGVTLIVVNELIIKKIVSQPRPAGSCLTSQGMPSSHSLLAVTFSLWPALEALFHTKQWDPRKKAGFIALVWILLLPVPASRVKLQDHSELQVGVGSAMGVGLATIFFLLFHFVFSPTLFPRLSRFSKRKFCKFLHIENDYGWPWPLPVLPDDEEEDTEDGVNQGRTADPGEAQKQSSLEEGTNAESQPQEASGAGDATTTGATSVDVAPVVASSDGADVADVSISNLDEQETK